MYEIVTLFSFCPFFLSKNVNILKDIDKKEGAFYGNNDT